MGSGGDLPSGMGGQAASPASTAALLPSPVAAPTAHFSAAAAPKSDGELPSGMGSGMGAPVAVAVAPSPPAAAPQVVHFSASAPPRGEELPSGMGSVDGPVAAQVAPVPVKTQVLAVGHFSALSPGGASGGEIPSGMASGAAATVPVEKRVAQALHFSASAGRGRDGELPCGMGQSDGAFVSGMGSNLGGAALLTKPFVTSTRRAMALVRSIGPATSGSGRRPKVSFVTCSYNRPDFLREAVESLRAQTDGDWEHLICDDSSMDPRVEETLKWAERDSRVRVWRRSGNLDAPAVLWNFMLDRAHGKYFSVLDDDNTKLPRFVEVLGGILDAEPLDFVTCGFVVVEPGRYVEYPLNLSTSPEALDQQSTCDGGAILYRRETFERIGYFSEALRTGEDWDWLRRAVRFSRYRNLQECFSTYRIHHAQRMTRSQSLGTGEDIERIKSRPLSGDLAVRVVRPPPPRLTRSQEDAISSIDRAVRTTPWVRHGNDLAVVLSPFQLSDEDIRHGIEGCAKVLSVHIEDPYALSANLDRVKAMVSSGAEVWVSTNDASTLPRYRDVVGDRVVVCPLLGVDEARAGGVQAGRDVDVLLCGYAYPSRKEFVADLLPRLWGRRVLLVGDGWEGYEVRRLAGGVCSVEVLPTQGLEETYRLHARSRAVICLHRTHGDCSDGPVEPQTVNRGYMEGYFGARVFLDGGRGDHSLDPGDVVWYDGAEALARKLIEYLAVESDVSAAVFAEKCRLLYTYQARVARLLNCVRSPRFLAVIP